MYVFVKFDKSSLEVIIDNRVFKYYLGLYWFLLVEELELEVVLYGYLIKSLLCVYMIYR